MNTFLPVPDFAQSAAYLDRARLGKQRVEVLQLLNGSWPHHPIAKLWAPYRPALSWYGLCICNEWLLRGYKDTCFGKIRELCAPDLTPPPWVGDPEFHASHRSNLLRKDYAYYSAFNWTEPTNLRYIWTPSPTWRDQQSASTIASSSDA